jgi:hypothetical protein
MRWDERLAGVFEDLEQQAEGLALAQRDAEVAELRRAEYAEVDLAARLHASVGRSLVLEVSGPGSLHGTLRRLGVGWCLVDAGAREWVVRLAAVGSIEGLVERAVPEAARPLTARLGLASVLRDVAAAGGDAVVHRVDGSWSRGALMRVGADFLDVRSREEGSGRIRTVPFTAVAAVRSA